MHEETRRFVSRMLNPIVAEFKREVAEQRANGASEGDIESRISKAVPEKRSGRVVSGLGRHRLSQPSSGEGGFRAIHWDHV